MFINTKIYKPCEDEILQTLTDYKFNINQARYVLDHVSERLSNYSYINFFNDDKDGDLNGSITSERQSGLF